MNLAISIRSLRDKIVLAINESQLPPSVLEPVINAIYLQVAQAAREEVIAAEKDEAIKEAEGNG